MLGCVRFSGKTTLWCRLEQLPLLHSAVHTSIQQFLTLLHSIVNTDNLTSTVITGTLLHYNSYHWYAVTLQQLSLAYCYITTVNIVTFTCKNCYIQESAELHSTVNT